MRAEANAVIDHLGGTSAVAKMIEAPLSTVHSWRKNGIPQSRMAHLRLAAGAVGIQLPHDLRELVHVGPNAAAQHDASIIQSSEKSNGTVGARA